MAFYWKGNSLFTRRIQLPAEQVTPETNFVLDYRNATTSMPNLLSIAQFLATSLTFVALEQLELWVDDYQIVSLTKKTAPSIQVPISKHIETKSKESLMKVESLHRESVQIAATSMGILGWRPSNTTKKPAGDSGYGGISSEIPSLRSFFSKLTQGTSTKKISREEQVVPEVIVEDLTATTTTYVFLGIINCKVKTNIPANFAAELERATKKPPPKQTKLAIVTSSYDESSASTEANAATKKVQIFANVLPSHQPGGRVFIGFPTSQSTGAGIHLSAPSIIPTVERESIDLNARYVRTWNIEMLRIAGIVTRLAYVQAMSDLLGKVTRAAELAGHGNKITKAEINQFIPEALHILEAFTFSASTPNSQVSLLIEEAFWTACRQPSIEIFSTKGVLQTSKVRLTIDDVSGFVEGIPVVPKSLLDSGFVRKLKEFGLIESVTIKDIKDELERKALDKDQLIQFVTWASRGHLDRMTLNSLLDVTVATIDGNGGQGEVIALATVKYFLNVNKIPSDTPLPPTTMPFSLTRTFKPHQLEMMGWEPLDILPWLRHLIEARTVLHDQDLTKNSAFAALVLQIVSKSFDGFGQDTRNTIASLLQTLTVGMYPTMTKKLA